MRTKQVKHIFFLMVLFFILIILPFILSKYWLNLTVSAIIFTLFALSYNILLGYGGLVSFGHSAYFGIGAYTAIYMFKHYHVDIITGLAGAGMAGALLGLILSLFMLRKKGMYFAILTLVFNMLVYEVAVKWRAVTGGGGGISAIRPNLYLPAIGTIDLFSIINWYYFVIVIVVLSAAFCWHFNKTPLGRLNVYIRESEERAKFIGYNVYIAKVAIFVISAFFAGIAGGLAGSFMEIVTPASVNLNQSINVLFMVFMGGTGTFWGPIIGTFLLIYLNDLTSTFTIHWQLIQGAIFILIVMYAPSGISGLIITMNEKLKEKFAHRYKRKEKLFRHEH